MIIPVLDLKNGEAVSGKSGERESYTPLKTIFYNSSSPTKIANALSQKGASRLYIADLDAIEGYGSNFEIVKEINKHILPTMLDCGVNNINDMENALEVSDKVIIATETLKNIEDLTEIFKIVPRDRIVISIDIKNGKLYSKHLKMSLEEFINRIKGLNPKEVILLDISRVGTESGIDIDLINKIKGTGDSIIIGGGITEKTLIELEKKGLNKFLVGSALHNGNLKVKF